MAAIPRQLRAVGKNYTTVEVVATVNLHTQSSPGPQSCLATIKRVPLATTFLGPMGAVTDLLDLASPLTPVTPTSEIHSKKHMTPRRFYMEIIH